MDAIDEIIRDYEGVVKVVDKDAKEQTDRAYGGMVRELKGKLQEHITEEIIKFAWQEIGGEANRLEINSKKIRIPILQDYIDRIADTEIRNYINAHKSEYYYGLSVDKHIFIDGQFVAGIECKAYTENAMLKRILVDFHLLSTLYPKLDCYLFQLESQLTGDYSELPEKVFGSKSTHSIMSYFPDVNLKIFTFLKGERKVDEPIHKFFKPLERKIVEDAVELLSITLRTYL